MALTNFKLLICLLILSESTLAQAECLRTVSEIKANNVSLLQNSSNAANFPCVRGAGAAGAQAGAGLSCVTRSI